MGRTFQMTGIILKGTPLGEADRLLTILSPEVGLMRAVAPGARKPKSFLRGRCELFVINQYLISQGRSLPRITQAETLESYPGLSQAVEKLAAGQYLAEVVLGLALSDQPQPDLYSLFNEHLRRLITPATDLAIQAYLAQALFHLLALGGFAPQVHHCCLSHLPIEPNFTDPRWQLGFSFEAGGLMIQPATNSHRSVFRKVNGIDVALLQQLSYPDLPVLAEVLPAIALKSLRVGDWVRVEHLLRDYAQFHLGRTFRAATLVDSVTVLDF